MRCKKCNAILEEGDLFCVNCGAEVNTNIPSKRICKNCGEALPDGSKFCIKCGCKVIPEEDTNREKVNLSKTSPSEFTNDKSNNYENQSKRYAGNVVKF